MGFISPALGEALEQVPLLVEGLGLVANHRHDSVRGSILPDDFGYADALLAPRAR